MRLALLPRTFPALGLGIALSYLSASPSLAQQGLPPSSGSGAGTGTGMSSGFPGSTGTGREAGGSTGTGRESLGTNPLGPVFPNPDLTRPIDRRPTGLRDNSRPIGMTTVSPDLFLDARSVNDPGERALALIRIGQTAIFSKQLDEAHTALFEAGPAALAERNPLIREQRLTAIIDTLISLAEERMGESSDVDVPTSLDAPLPLPTSTQPPPPPGPGVAPSPSLTPPPPTAPAPPPAATTPSGSPEAGPTPP